MKQLFAFVGSYPDSPNPGGGGITVLDVTPDGSQLRVRGHVDMPRLAGHLDYAPNTRTLYAVDERKTDGRGPVDPPAAVFAFRVDSDANLTSIGSIPTLGPRPTFVAHHRTTNRLITANHGDFEHVERVVKVDEGRWAVEYVYDDSTVVLYELSNDGAIAAIADVHIRAGHGPDPNASRQNGGHAQASAHAHCATLDPSGRFVIVCDKGTDEIVTFDVSGGHLRVVAVYTMAPQSGPRHLAFDRTGTRAFATLEFVSELASFDFDATTGWFEPLDRVRTTAAGFAGPNEPAEVRVHPNGRFVYVNNRGEDSLVWFHSEDGALTRTGHVSLARSIHPGLAARSFMLSADGTLLLMADRPANAVRSYRVNQVNGSLLEVAHVAIDNPAYVLLTDFAV